MSGRGGHSRLKLQVQALNERVLSGRAWVSEAARDLYDQLRALEGRAQTARGRNASRREAAKATGRPPYSTPVSGQRISSWLADDPARAQVPSTRLADQVWAIVRVWSDWAGEKPQSRRYWADLIERAQPVRVRGSGPEETRIPGPGQEEKSRLPSAAIRPYLLLETGQVVGRDRERSQVVEFLDRSGDGPLVLLLIGIAGVGKSALAWDVWSRSRSGPQRCFWYSFYEGHGTTAFQAFLDELGLFLGLEDSSVRTIQRELSARGAILFLDGLERCLRFHQRPTSAGDLESVQLEEVIERGLSDEDLGFSSQDAYTFLVMLTQLPTCKVVATSRVIPADYLGSGGGLRSGVRALYLGPLGVEGGAQLLTSIGMDITRGDAGQVTEAFAGHPYALQLVACQARKAMRTRKNLAAWLKNEGYTATGGEGPSGVSDRLYARAVEGLSPPARLALAAVGVVGGSIGLPDLWDLTHLAVSEDEDTFRRTVIEVSTSGLGVETAEAELACHPLSAAAAIRVISPADLRELTASVAEMLKARYQEFHDGDDYFAWFMTGDRSDRVEVMALCKALIRVRNWKEAADLYLNQLLGPILNIEGANFEAVDLIRQIVDGLESEPDDDAGRLLGEIRPFLAYHLLMTAHLAEADGCLRALSDRGRDWLRGLRETCELATHLGQMERAVEIAADLVHRARRSIVIADCFDLRGAAVLGFGWDPAVEFARKMKHTALTELFDSAALGVRAILAADHVPDAALLNAELIGMRYQSHRQCEGCRGLLLRTASEVLAAAGNIPMAEEVATLGQGMQEGQGKSLQGILSEVLLAMVSPREPELAASLGVRGFVLYQLMLEAAASDPDIADRARSALERSGALYALSMIPPRTHVWNVRHEVSDRLVGWAVEERAWHLSDPNRERARREAVPEDAPEFPVVAALRALAEKSLPDEHLAAIGRAFRTGETTVPGAAKVLWHRLSMGKRAEAQAHTGTSTDRKRLASLEAALALNPVDSDTLEQLARAAVSAGDTERGLKHISELVSVFSFRSSYTAAVDLAEAEPAMIDPIRTVISRQAKVDRGAEAAYRALARLERITGDEEAALAWEERITAYNAQDWTRLPGWMA
jgi:hypothetical protein